MDSETEETQEGLVHRLIARVTDNLVTLLKLNGITKEKFLSYVDQSYEAVEIPKRTSKVASLPPGFQDLLAALLSSWRNNSETTDTTMGDPIDLPPRGPAPSFEALYNQAIPRFPNVAKKMSIDDVIDYMVSDGCIRQNGKTLSFARSYSSVTATPEMTAPSYLNYLRVASDTIANNATALESKTRLFQRQSNVPDFPFKSIPLLNAKIESEGMAFLEKIDPVIENFAAKRSASSDGARGTVGVSVIFFTHEE